jgi:ribosome maturation factor RimP
VPYTLEVSSPGADKPLLLPRQYPKHTGREMEVKLKVGTILTGRLAQADEQAITLQLKDKKKRYTDQSPTTQVAYTDISEAKVIISFR